MKNLPQIKNRVIKPRKDNQQVIETFASEWKQQESPDYKSGKHRSGSGRALGLGTQPNFCHCFH